MVMPVTWTETTILVNGVPARRSSRCGVKSLRSDSLTMRVTGVRIAVFSGAIVIDVIVHCPTAGRPFFESKCRKQLSLSSCGWVLIRSGQFKITELVRGDEDQIERRRLEYHNLQISDHRYLEKSIQGPAAKVESRRRGTSTRLESPMY